MAIVGTNQVDPRTGQVVGKTVIGNQEVTAEGQRRIDAQNAARGDLIFGGTPYEDTVGHRQDLDSSGRYISDARNFMYGRDPNGANNASNLALTTGANAQQAGYELAQMGLDRSAAAMGRDAKYGNWDQQNGALDQTAMLAYGLGSLENTRGPSGAQAQLMAGNNQAMAAQLALARSGRGLGGSAAAMGQAQGNIAELNATNANNSALLAAQEDAAWRQRMAANLGNAGQLQLAMGQQYAGQQTADLNSYYANRDSNDQAALNWANNASQNYFTGTNANFAGQGISDQVRGRELAAGQAAEDTMLRYWAAKNGFDLQQAAARSQETGALLGAGGAVLGGVAGAFAGGPVGAAGGAAAGSAAGNAVGRKIG